MSASHCLEDLKQEGKCQQTPPREVVCQKVGWSILLRGSLDISVLPQQGTLRSQQTATSFPGVLSAPGTQPSGAELAAPSLQGTAIPQHHLPSDTT